jgi:glycine dehydrogenase subunit 1
VKALTAIPGVDLAFTGPSAHEVVLRFEQPVRPLVDQLCAQGILPGVILTNDYPALGACLLVCCTELISEADIQTYAHALKAALKSPASSTAKATVI